MAEKRKFVNVSSRKETLITDESLMPFGKHKDEKMIDVPAEHLLWLYNNDRAGRLKGYIEENMDALKLEMEKSGKTNH